MGPLAPAEHARVADGLAHAFGSTFWVALALITIALVPAFLQPRAGRPMPLSPTA